MVDNGKLKVSVKSNTLNETQKTVLTEVYDQLKVEMKDVIDAIEHLTYKTDLESTVDFSKLVVRIVSTCIKFMERIDVNDIPLSGNDKKIISIELGKLIIQKEVKNTSVQEIILNIYDIIADSTIDTIIDVSKNVNIKIKHGIKSIFSCCP